MATTELTAERAREQLDALNGARDRLREEPDGEGGIDSRPRQLSFDVGQRGGQPDFASVKVAGSMPISRDLRKRREFTVRITDEHGELVSESKATCTNVAFPDKTDKYGTTTERVHTLTLE